MGNLWATGKQRAPERHDYMGTAAGAVQAGGAGTPGIYGTAAGAEQAGAPDIVRRRRSFRDVAMAA